MCCASMCVCAEVCVFMYLCVCVSVFVCVSVCKCVYVSSHACNKCYKHLHGQIRIIGEVLSQYCVGAVRVIWDAVTAVHAVRGSVT